jgi:hypothetical protein
MSGHSRDGLLCAKYSGASGRKHAPAAVPGVVPGLRAWMNAMTPLPVAARWFERSRVDEVTTLITEPHVIALMRCNIWHVRGRDHDLLVDTGMGLCSVAGELAGLIDKPVIAVATHGHDDRTRRSSRSTPGTLAGPPSLTSGLSLSTRGRKRAPGQRIRPPRRR